MRSADVDHLIVMLVIWGLMVLPLLFVFLFVMAGAPWAW